MQTGSVFVCHKRGQRIDGFLHSLSLWTRYLPQELHRGDDSSMMKWQPLRTESEKHGMIYLGSMFVILNKAFRDHRGQIEREGKKKSNVPL